MYAVIMAGGGGTRLHPLSRPERPKPFLPLLGDRSLLQATAARLPTTDITVVTDRRYERFVRDQLPTATVLLEPMGRNTAAAIALATLAIDRPEDDVMIVVPADAHIDPARDDVYRDVLREGRRPPRDGLLRHRPATGDARRPGRASGDRPTATSSRTSRPAGTSRASTPIGCSGSRRSPASSAPRTS